MTIPEQDEIHHMQNKCDRIVNKPLSEIKQFTLLEGIKESLQSIYHITVLVDVIDGGLFTFMYLPYRVFYVITINTPVELQIIRVIQLSQNK